MLPGCENPQRFALIARFSMHWGQQCAAPNELLDAGPGNAPKGASPGIGIGVHECFFLVFGLQCL